MSLFITTLKKIKNRAVQKYKIRTISQQYSDMMTAATPPSSSAGRRINIILPSITSQATFGGVATALRFFYALAKEYPSARIVAMYDAPASFEKDLWDGWALGEDLQGRSIQFLGGGANPSIPVSDEDVFVATEYRTAYLGRSLIAARIGAGFHPKPLVYLIQDFEPLFFPWSTRYLLADSTYRSDQPTFAVFNTKLLGDYFAGEGHAFAQAYSFEPKINGKIAKWLPQAGDIVAKRKKILIYGRPGTHRNAFELIVLALKQWAVDYTHSADWDIESLGEHHDNIDLPNGKQIVSRGKVTLEAYAATLKEAAVGISLMVSPHPSYPPLEMASFGLGVLTNNFRNKDLSTFHSGIESLPSVTPPGVAAALQRMCSAFTADPQHFQREGFTGYDFLIEGDEFPFKAKLLDDLTEHAR